MRQKTLTQIMHAEIKAAPSGKTAMQIAKAIGLNYQSFMSALSGQERHKFDADLVLPVSKEAGTEAAVNYLARGLGGVFVRLPAPRAARNDVVGKMAITIREFGEMIAETAEAIEDGEVTESEYAEFEQKHYAALQATVTLGILIAQKHKEASYECQAH